jgi:hypothetical protein
MQLLRFDQHERLVITDFHGKTIPPYAILSHRWSDTEILLEDIGSRTYRRRRTVIESYSSALNRQPRTSSTTS